MNTICRGWMLFLAVAIIALCACSSDERSANLDPKEERDAAMDISVEIQSTIPPHSDEGNEVYFFIYSTPEKKLIIDPLAILDSSGFVDAMTEINRSGVVAFEDKYLKNKKLYFYDEKGNEFEVSDMAIQKKEPWDTSAKWHIDGVLNNKTIKNLPSDSKFIGYDRPIKYEPLKINYIVDNAALEDKSIKNDVLLDFRKKGRIITVDFDRDGLEDIFISGVTTKNKQVILPIKYGNGQNSVHTDFGQRIEQLYNIDIVGFFDYDKDEYIDILLECNYYESTYYIVLKNNNGKTELAFRTAVRYID